MGSQILPEVMDKEFDFKPSIILNHLCINSMQEKLDEVELKYVIMLSKRAAEPQCIFDMSCDVMSDRRTQRMWEEVGSRDARI